MSLSTGQLFLTALNSSAPVLILISIGVLFNLTNVIPGKNYRLLNNITFKYAITISAVYTIGRQNFSQNDLKMILALMLIIIVGFIINIPLCFLYVKSERLYAYAHISAVTLINNSVFSGFPVFSGIYDPALAARYAYIQMLVCFGFALIFVYLQFEVAKAAGEKNQLGKSSKQVESSVKLCENSDKIDKNGVKTVEINTKTPTNSSPKKQNILQICLLKTIKQPLLISVFIAVLYNAIGIKIPYLKNLPPYFSVFFSNFSSISSPMGLLSLGMFAADLIRSKQPVNVETGLVWQIACFVLICAYRSFVLPLILIFIAKALGIDHLTAEINAGIYSSPAATFTYSICDEYGFGAGWAGLQCSLGVIVSMCAIPVIQKVSRAVYGVQ